MDQQNAHCSHDIEKQEPKQTQNNKTDAASEISEEKCKTRTKPFTITSTISYSNNEFSPSSINSPSTLPFVIISKHASFIIQTPTVIQQPKISSNLPSPTSLIPGQPLSLFLQAYAKLNQSSLNDAVINYFRNIKVTAEQSGTMQIAHRTTLSPPDSLISAPPSYSFVLRQIAVRRRPRILGTFIPSPSFVQHTPPPTYAAAFDIYIDTPMPPSHRVYNFGFTSIPVVCPECGYAGMTLVISKITLCTHLCALILCVLCCWICAPLPYMLSSCKDVYHYCRHCRNFLGMYCPTNPENTLN